MRTGHTFMRTLKQSEGFPPPCLRVERAWIGILLMLNYPSTGQHLIIHTNEESCDAIAWGSFIGMKQSGFHECAWLFTCSQDPPSRASLCH